MRVPVQRKVNGLRLSDSSLKSGGDMGRGSIPDITLVFNAPRSLDNRRSDLLLLVFTTKLGWMLLGPTVNNEAVHHLSTSQISVSSFLLKMK